MKKIIASMFTCLFMLSCADDSWKQELEDIKAELANQKQLIEALQQNSTITGIEQGNGQYTIKFSNGQAITLTNGKTPIITIGENGNWFIDGVDTGKPSKGEDGADGADGSNGTNGEDGTDGTNGTDGKTPTIEIGTNGNWIINGTDTGINAQGQNGSTPTVEIGANGNWFINGVDTGKPSKGEDGTNGTDGKTPTVEIGDNGNWIINGTDTGVKAEGIDGNDAPYITSITIIYDTFFFHFSDGNLISVPLISPNSTLNTKNLFNPQKAVIINGYNFIRSEFIPISKGEALTASTNTTLWQTNCALYDANFNILADSKIYIKDNSKTVTLKWIEGAAYAKFEFRNISDLNQIEKGEKATNYERYTNNRDLLKILSLPSSIPLLTNYNYSIFTDNIIYKTANTESGFYIKDYPIYNDRFIIESSIAGSIEKEFRIYNNNQVDNSGFLNFTFYDPEKYRGKEINILTIGDSFGDIGTFIESIKNKMNSYGININLLGTHNKIETRKSESLSGGNLKNYILTPSGDGATITATNITEDNHIPQSTYGSPQYQDANGTKWSIIGNKKMKDGSYKLRLGKWNNDGTWGQVIPPTGDLIKIENKGEGLEKITYTNGESCPFNPFWNPQTEKPDFNYYIKYWEFNTPDIIILQFTWNDLPNYASKQKCEIFASNLETVIDIIHSQLPDCKIIFSIEPAGAIYSNKGTYFIDGSHYTRLLLNDVLQQEFDKTKFPFLYIAPSYAFVNRRKSFNSTTETPNPDYPTDNIEYVSDGIHCNTNGMKQIADCIMPYIIAAMN